MQSPSDANVQAILNVTAQSLARHCGIDDDPSNPDLRLEARRFADLKRQLGIMQTWPNAQANVIYCEFAAKYLPDAVARYKTFTTPSNTAMTMVNIVSHLPYFVRLQKTPAASDLVVLQATRMANATEDPSDPDLIAEMCQFLSTLFVLQGTTTIPEDVKKKLVSKLGGWRHRYQDQFLGETADRCYQYLTGGSQLLAMAKMMKGILEKPLNECGAQGCGRRMDSVGSELRKCGRCKSAVYCGAVHQKQHWPEHKKSCYPATF